jgi:DNA gyrase/topoisomerase IV subunit A
MTEEENQQQLDASLKRLRSELESADEPTRERLQALIERVERQLEGGEEQRRGLIKELEEEIMHFEVEHPRLTAIVNDIMVALSNMGI